MSIDLKIEENYFIIDDELNPDAWGFDDKSMTKRAKLEAVQVKDE